MKPRHLIAAAAIALGMYLAVSCKKDKEKCLHCTATCPGTSVSDLHSCGGNLDQDEANYRAANAGCTINCTRQ